MIERKSKEKEINRIIDVEFMHSKAGSHFSTLSPSQCLREVKDVIKA